MTNIVIDKWVEKILVDPITKKEKKISEFKKYKNIIDARIFLRNSQGFEDWSEGQKEFEEWEISSVYYKSLLKNYIKEKNRDELIYEYFPLDGDILDVGGLSGTTREFIKRDSRYISIDPYIKCLEEIPKPKLASYKCLSEKLNFIGGMAEFLPFKDKCFNWVHMRSIIDHVQVPDLALKEAKRVLKDEGSILIGLSVDGGKEEKKTNVELLKELLKDFLVLVGFKRYKDHHIFHPTLSNLKKLIQDNGFVISDLFWQPGWNNKVVYIKANKNLELEYI